MSKEPPFTKEEVREYLVERNIESLEQCLEEAGMKKDVSFDFLRNPDGSMVVFSKRIPFLIKHNNQKYVLKTYENYEQPEIEKKIMVHLQGSLAPDILYLGKNFFIEEYIDPAIFFPLDKIADNKEHRIPDNLALTNASKIGGQIYAKLAKKQVIYTHNRWIYEFQTSPNRDVVVDLALGKFFRRKGDMKVFDDIIDLVGKGGLSAFTENLFKYLGISVSGNKELFEETNSTIENLNTDLESKLNIMNSWNAGFYGLRQYLETRQPGSVLACSNLLAENKALPIQFLHSFRDEYVGLGKA
ncbi:MAG: hypothetical protein WCK90_04305 [archaeon]